MTVQCKQKQVSYTHVCMYKNCVSVTATAQLLARGVYSYIVTLFLTLLYGLGLLCDQ